MKIHDALLLNDELDLLELRLMEIGDLVDTVTVVECPHDWQQRQKPLHFAENFGRFVKWQEKLHHVVCQDYVRGPHPQIEWPQRRALYRGFEDAAMTDYIMIGDADEIPSRSAIEEVTKRRFPHAVVLEQDLFYHWVNLKQKSPWRGTIIMPRGLGWLDCQKIRDTRNQLMAVPDGGWHFSWLGSVEQVQHKLRCHTIAEDAARYGSKVDPPDPEDAEFLATCIDTGADMFSRTEEYAEKQFVEVLPGETHPVTIGDWLKLHPEYEKKTVAA